MENPTDKPQKVRIGLRAEVALALVMLLTLSGLAAMIYGLLGNRLDMLVVGFVSLTIAGIMGLLILSPRRPKRN
ncbi:MAG: hypothetical protein RLZZ519_1383 [Bacteroidota bacterium]|jgi:hypothetical protein